MPVLVMIGLVGLGLILALSHHGLAALVVGGLFLALLIVAPLVENAISADTIARRPRPRAGRRRRP
jgi:hypothetical protein